MIRLTRGLRIVLGLCLLALGIFGVGSAQAATNWMVKGTNVTENGKNAIGKVVLKTGAEEKATLKTKISGNEVKFSCKKATLEGVGLELAGALTTGGKVKFTECTTAINGTTQKACEPVNGAEKGVIISNPGKGGLTIHSTGEGVTIIESTVKETIEKKEVPVFGHVKMGEECSIGEDVPIIGPKLGIVDVAGMGAPQTKEQEEKEGVKLGLLHEEKVHKIKEGPLTEIWAISETAEHKAEVIGEAEVELASGFNWSGLLS